MIIDNNKELVHNYNDTLRIVIKAKNHSLRRSAYGKQIEQIYTQKVPRGADLGIDDSIIAADDRVRG